MSSETFQLTKAIKDHTNAMNSLTRAILTYTDLMVQIERRKQGEISETPASPTPGPTGPKTPFERYIGQPREVKDD